MGGICRCLLKDAIETILNTNQGRFESDDTLAGLCTTACSTALSTWTRRITGACGTQRFETDQGLAWLPQAFAEQFTERFNVVCLRNSLVILATELGLSIGGSQSHNKSLSAPARPASSRKYGFEANEQHSGQDNSAIQF